MTIDIDRLRAIAEAVNAVTPCTCSAQRARAEAAEAAIERVRKIHEPLDAVMYVGDRSFPRQVCTGCGTDDGNWQRWPCPTIRALEVTP